MLFDASRFLTDNFTTPDELIKFLSGFGVKDVPVGTAAKWWVRGQVPGKWALLLLALIEIDRGPVSLAEYVRRK